MGAHTNRPGRNTTVTSAMPGGGKFRGHGVLSWASDLPHRSR